MDRTKRTIAISATLIASVTMLTVGLYLKAMNADVAETAGMPQGTEQMEMMDNMPGMMGAEMMEKEIDLPQPGAELSEQDIEAILKEIMDSGELEMNEEEITVDETE